MIALTIYVVYLVSMSLRSTSKPFVGFLVQRIGKSLYCLVNFCESIMISWFFMVGFYGSGVCDSLVSFCRFPRPQCLQDIVFLYILQMMRWSQAWCINVLLHSWNSRCKDNGTFFRSPCFEFSACVHSLISTHPEKNTTWIFLGVESWGLAIRAHEQLGFPSFFLGSIG